MINVTGRVVDDSGFKMPGLVVEAIGEWLLTTDKLASDTSDVNGNFLLKVPEILSFDDIPRPFKLRVTDPTTKRVLTAARELNGVDKNQNVGDIKVNSAEAKGLLVTNGASVPKLVSEANTVKLLVDGVEAFGQVADDIRSARHSINITQLFFSVPEEFKHSARDEKPDLIFKFLAPDLDPVDPLLPNQHTPVPRGETLQTSDDRPERLLIDAALTDKTIRLLLNEPATGFPEVIFWLGVATPIALMGAVGGVALILLWMGIGIPFFPIVLAATILAYFAEFILVKTFLEHGTHVDEARRYFGRAIADAAPLNPRITIQGFRQELPDHGVFHCKMVITDEKRAVIVGSPFEQRYFDSQLHKTAEALRGGNSSDAVHDLSVAVVGPAVHDLYDSFRVFWNKDTVTGLLPDAPVPDRETGDELYKVQVVRTLSATRFTELKPSSEKGILEGYLRAFAAAKHYIYLETQYFTDSVITEALVEVLKKNTGLELILVVPIKPDVLFYPRRQAHRIDQLREAGGARVGVFTRWAYDENHSRPWVAPVYIHAKGAVVDDSWATVGSANLDGLSLDYNLLLSPLTFGETTATELNLNVLPPAEGAVTLFAQQMRKRLFSEHLGLVDQATGKPDPNHNDLQHDQTHKWLRDLWRPTAEKALDHVKAGKKEPLHGFVLEYPKEDGGWLDTPRKHLAALGVPLKLSEARVRPITGTRKFNFSEGKWDKALEREDFRGAEQ